MLCRHIPRHADWHHILTYSLNCYSLKPISVVLDGLEPSIDWVPVFIEEGAGTFAAGPQDYLFHSKRKTRDSNLEAR